MKVAVVIPARLKSTRLENKIILDIIGKPLIQRVYEQVQNAKSIDQIYIATDSEEIARTCKPFTDNIIMTSPNHQSGTDRIVEALSSIDYEGVINVQGDEPLIDKTLLNNLAQGLKEEVPILSAMHRINTVEELMSPDNVKVVTDNHLNAIYFSRSVIPYDRNDWAKLTQMSVIPEDKIYYKHIGVYAFQRDILLSYANWPLSKLEQTEKLEQLRILDNGHKIRMIETTYQSVGVDTASDLEKVRKIFQKELND